MLRLLIGLELMRLPRLKRTRRKSGSGKKVDGVLLALVIILMVFGLVMITSIGVPKSIQLSAPDVLYPNCDDVGVDCYLLFRNHLLRLVVGAVLMFLVAKINYKFWKKTAPAWFVLTLILLFAVLIWGTKYTTFARSWLPFFGASFQPTEFAKLFLIFYLASWMDKKRDTIKSLQNGFLPFCVIVGALVLPVVLQPDLGSTMVIAMIATSMFFVAGAKLRHILLGLLIVVFAGTILVANLPHLKDRFTAFVSSDVTCKEDYCWQTEQAKIAAGSGGFWGKGLTQGVQKSYWLPQATDDFIFAASAEELGFLKIALLVLAYTIIGWRGFLIAQGASNRFVQLTAIGLTSWIVFQAFLNIAVNIALFPVTGITLPLVSYGGSSLLSILIAVGILLQLSKHSDYENTSGGRGQRRTYHTKYSAS
jgi:cell division protein FtsW